MAAMNTIQINILIYCHRLVSNMSIQGFWYAKSISGVIFAIECSIIDISTMAARRTHEN